MHPLNYLFEDLYRNYWGIGRGNPPTRRRAADAVAKGGRKPRA